MNPKPELLCVGHDALLNRTRRLILERCFEVQNAHSVAEAIAFLSGKRFDLVVLCYTLADDEFRATVEFIHSLPSPIRILALAEGRDPLLLGAQDEEFAGGGPAELLNRAIAMAGIPPQGAGGCAAEDPGLGPEEKAG
jgi:hypothetical protein